MLVAEETVTEVYRRSGLELSDEPDKVALDCNVDPDGPAMGMLARYLLVDIAHKKVGAWDGFTGPAQFDRQDTFNQ
jgi:hypothetical protein